MAPNLKSFEITLQDLARNASLTQSDPSYRSFAMAGFKFYLSEADSDTLLKTVKGILKRVLAS